MLECVGICCMTGIECVEHYRYYRTTLFTSDTNLLNPRETR